jgi:hypothetical protein
MSTKLNSLRAIAIHASAIRLREWGRGALLSSLPISLVHLSQLKFPSGGEGQLRAERYAYDEVRAKRGKDAGRGSSSATRPTEDAAPRSSVASAPGRASKRAAVVCVAIAMGMLLTAAPALAHNVNLFTTTFGAASSTPSNPHPLSNPSGVAVDNTSGPSAGDIYVTDPANHRVEKFNAAGEFLFMLGTGVLSAGAEGTGDLTKGSTEITSVATTEKAFLLGQTLTGPGIPADTTIAALGESTIPISNPAT